MEDTANSIIIIDDAYPELKNRLLEAISKKDPEELSSALNAIDREVPPSRLTEKDKDIAGKAKDLLEKLDSDSSMQRY